MNIYVVTEGMVEASVFSSWIPFINQNLSEVDYINEVDIDNFLIITARGFPNYYNVIEEAISDVNENVEFNRLVISVDSEDLSLKEKNQEIEEFILTKECRVDIRIVIQHFCFETWALGNRRAIRPNPKSLKLRQYINYFNVRRNDPELLPPKHDEGLNRAKFAEKYLRLALNDKFRNLTYSKRNPQAVMHNKYFGQVKSRYEETGHISSFGSFLDAFL